MSAQLTKPQFAAAFEAMAMDGRVRSDLWLPYAYEILVEGKALEDIPTGVKLRKAQITRPIDNLLSMLDSAYFHSVIAYYEQTLFDYSGLKDIKRHVMRRWNKVRHERILKNGRKANAVYLAKKKLSADSEIAS